MGDSEDHCIVNASSLNKEKDWKMKGVDWGEGLLTPWYQSDEGGSPPLLPGEGDPSDRMMRDHSRTAASVPPLPF